MGTIRRTALATLSIAGLSIAGLLLPMVVTGPAAGAQPTMYTQEQIAAQMLTQAQVAKATGFKGRLKKDAGATYCGTNGTYNICMNGWTTKAAGGYPATISVWSMPTADETTTVLGEYIGTLAGAGYRQVTIETNPVVLVYEAERNGGDTDTVTMMRANGTAMYAGTCQRPASHASVGPLVACAKKLTAAQVRQAPPG